MLYALRITTAFTIYNSTSTLAPALCTYLDTTFYGLEKKAYGLGGRADLVGLGTNFGLRGQWKILHWHALLAYFFAVCARYPICLAKRCYPAASLRVVK